MDLTVVHPHMYIGEMHITTHLPLLSSNNGPQLNILLLIMNHFDLLFRFAMVLVLLLYCKFHTNTIREVISNEPKAHYKS